MNYIYLTNKSIEEIEADIKSGEIILNDSHVLETDTIWVINKKSAKQDREMLAVNAIKVTR